MMSIALNKMPSAKLNNHINNAEKFINEFTK